ncbi:hypothetical protein ACHAXR_009889 [Thalassiosira sp. AJA248-18]
MTVMVSLASTIAFVLAMRVCSNSISYARAFMPQPRFYAVNTLNNAKSSWHLQQHRYSHRSPSHASSLRLSSPESDVSDIDQVLPTPDVLCVGEALWDSLPSGIYLGGAPTNVAVHLASLFRSSLSSANPTVAVAACLGKDQLGKEAQRRLSICGVRTEYLQFHSEWETGMATAIIDENGDATYEFNTPAAWDNIHYGDKLQNLIQPNVDVMFVMGTIAGRLQNDHGATSSSTLATIRNSAPEGTVVLDVNLRSPWYTPECVLELAKGEAAAGGEGESSKGGSSKKLALLKLNEEELVTLEQWCGVKGVSDPNEGNGLAGPILEERMDQLATSLNTQRVCVTRGKDGAALLCKRSNDDNEFYEHSGYSATSNNDSDTVGAGDAFLAALVNSLFIQNELPERALERACALGGYVASCRGATPEHGDAPEDLKRVFSESN